MNKRFWILQLFARSAARTNLRVRRRNRLRLELLEERALLAFDFGDAPNGSYPTLLAFDGARHDVGGPLFLGASVDSEADGQPNGTATGDDLAGIDDENGVNFTSALIPGNNTSLTVNASVGGGKLDAWVDFNADGDWFDAGEHIFTNQALAAGDNLLSFAVPAVAAMGATTIARFRLSTAGGLAPTGAAADGEVEDYSVQIANTTVTNTNDDGLGSLRVAILASNGAPGVQTIGFSIFGATPHTIQPLSQLPTITGTAVIDGTTNVDSFGKPVIELDGSLAGSVVDGLTVTAGNTTVRGLVINRFSRHGLVLKSGGNNLVVGNYIGTDYKATTDLGNAFNGIFVQSSSNNTIGGTATGARNIISGNNQSGISLFGASSSGNLVQGNLLGVDLNGTVDLGNSASGIIVSNAPSNTIGGTTTAERNLISGNDQNGVYLVGTGTFGSVVQGNYIGVNTAGTAALGNGLSGVSISNAPSNTIGGTAAGVRNVISGNLEYGITLAGSSATGNLVQANFIGTNYLGIGPVPNNKSGVFISGASLNSIGGTTTAARNVISGNKQNGVYLFGAGATGNLVQGNYIGTSLTGNAAIGNTLNGVLIYSAPANTIGGTAAGAANLISGNVAYGLYLSAAGATGNLVQGNSIGTNAAASGALGNKLSGVFISNAPANTIGGTVPGARNVISGNRQNGIYFLGTGSTSNVVQGNYVGTDISGSVDLGNTFSGFLVSGAGSNTIGGTLAGSQNLISGNNFYGVYLLGAGATGNLIQGNFIGTNAAGTGSVGNSFSGVFISSASSNTIGGTDVGSSNTIGFNGSNGVRIKGASTGNAILQNSFFSNVGPGIDLNGDGATANDVDDPDVGANNKQNFPVIASAILSGPNLNITYSVPSIAPNSTFPLRIEFFIADADNQEGQVFLGSDSYTAPGSQLATIPAGPAILGTKIVATATDANGNTSEFSAFAAIT